MNAKSKKYYQGLCQMNKENVLLKPSKSKPSSEKDITKASHSHASKSNNLFVHLQHKNPTSNHVGQVQHQMTSVTRSDSKKNIIAKGGKDLDLNKESKDKVMKLPRINKDDCSTVSMGRKRHSRSYKKILTEPHDFNDEQSLHLRTLSPNESMKEVLMSIVKNKESRHLASIDQQIDKLETLTKRYSCLRKDLVSIQEDILTISFKQKCRERGKEASESTSVVFM